MLFMSLRFLVGILEERKKKPHPSCARNPIDLQRTLSAAVASIIVKTRCLSRAHHTKDFSNFYDCTRVLRLRFTFWANSSRQG